MQTTSRTPCTPDCFANPHQFRPAIDRPAGRIDCVPSGVTGKPLRYFTPDPLPDLLERTRTEPATRPRLDPLLALILIRAAARNTTTGDVDLPQARRFLELLRKAAARPTVDDLIELARSIHPRIDGIRQEIIFVGGMVPSSARHIYAPYAAIRDLMEALAEGLNSDESRRGDPLIVSATVGAFCVYLHPFVDGNGRWSRLVSASTAATRDAQWPAMVGVAFQNACKSPLSKRVLPDATTGGLREYLQSALRFETLLMRELSDSGALSRAAQLTEVFAAATPSQRAQYEVLGRLFATGRLPLAEARASLGLSQRAVDGLMQKTVSAVAPTADVHSALLDAGQLIAQIDASVERAAHDTFT